MIYGPQVPILKAYKFALEPTKEQIALLRTMCGHARFVWNKALRECHTLKEDIGFIPSYFDMTRWVTDWKEEPEMAWLKDAYTDNLQQKLRDLRQAWSNCFDKSLAAKEPVFKKKSKARDSIRFVNFPKYCTLDNRRIKLPNGLGWMKFKRSREIYGDIKNATVSFHGGRWYISLQVEVEKPRPLKNTTCVGADLGIAKTIALSNGEVTEALNAFKKGEKKLKVEQRKLSRKVKFSKNWFKQKAIVNRLHRDIAFLRHDFLHKSTSALSKNHAMVAVEDLKVINMSASAEGTIEQPGSNVKAKSGLNKAILDQGWGMWRRQLEYKMDWCGGIVVAVPPMYTSQRCSCCGHTAKENRVSQSVFTCVACGHTENADVNAAKNILAAGHAVLACGESVQQGRSLKQEPVRTRNRACKSSDKAVSPATAVML
jgi:putative transposase